MPAVVSFLHSNAFRPKEVGCPGEGQVFNVIKNRWEEPAIGEKEQLIGYREGDAAAADVTEEHSIGARLRWPYHALVWCIRDGSFM